MSKYSVGRAVCHPRSTNARDREYPDPWLGFGEELRATRRHVIFFALPTARSSAAHRGK
jgi:hypothetical protein